MKDVGLVGLPYAGKSTLFTALTHTGGVGGRANQAVVSVPDPRLPVLAEMERSKKVVAAQVRFVDVPGGTGSAQGLAALRETDALAIVLRAFGTDANPQKDLAEIEADLLVADLAALEGGLEKAEKKGHRDPSAGAEAGILRKAVDALNAERPLRDAGLSPEDTKVLRGYAPLTLKPRILVANLEEGATLPAGLPDGAVGVYAAIEAEVAEMDPEEGAALLAEFGVERPGLPSVIEASYRVLDLITFLTTGEDETRAWEVRRGAHAPEAAGVIHTDLERGFIRAEVISYDELVAAGSLDAAKHAGKLRVEGKDYEVREGDILNIRFAV
jgi:ribosome-binding ATPase YchF (GTP1/OBG family)